MAKSFLITGPAGSGKTAHCLRLCRDRLNTAKPHRIVCLVPGGEAVRVMEKNLLSRSASPGLLGSVSADFVSLAARILNEARCYPSSRIGILERKYLLLRITRNTPLAGFEAVKGYDGFAEVLGNFIAELKRAMIPPEEFLRVCLKAEKQHGGISHQKVSELHAVYNAYHEVLQERNAYDGDGLQWMAAEVLDRDPALLSSVELLLADGFATYTPVEIRILSLLLRRVAESHITLCYESGRPEVFGFVEETYNILKKLCSEKEIVLSGNHRAAGGLLHLERNLFSEEEKQLPSTPPVSIKPCFDALDEAETVAREIQRIREEEGLEYGDFAVILRDVGDYSRFISEVFSARRIPFFLSASTQLAEQPFVRGVLSALRILKSGFQHPAVLHALKNSYMSDDKDVAAAIENLVEELGLGDEERFRRTWTDSGQTSQDVAPLEDHKARFLSTLDELRAQAEKISTSEEFRQFVLRAIGILGFFRSFNQNDKGGEAQGLPRVGDTTASSTECPSLGTFVSLLDALCDYARLTGMRHGDYAAFLDLLERGLSWVALPSPPRTLSSVRVSSIVGGPPPEAGVVFICGLCERSFPKEISDEPFLKDRERSLINRQGRRILDERSPLSAGERFFFYLAVSRARRRLILTYPAVDIAGKELVRSHYVEETARLFSGLKETCEQEPPGFRVVPDFEDIADIPALQHFIAAQFSRSLEQGGEMDDRQAIAALAYNELVASIESLSDRFLYLPPTAEVSLSPEITAHLKKKKTYPTSVSELEDFGRCPFRHFCNSRLKLKEPARFEFEHKEEGILYHEILARLYRLAYLPPDAAETPPEKAPFPSPCAIEDLPPGQLDRVLDLFVDEFIEDRYSRLFDSPRMQVRLRRLKATLRDFLLKEVENERTNATRPTYFELSFGRGRSRINADSRSTSEPLCLETQNLPQIRIAGRIDRADIFQTKGSARKDLEKGDVLQAGIYMRALRDLFRVEPAGALYYSISSSTKRGIYLDEEEARIKGDKDLTRTDKASLQGIAELIELNSRQAIEYVERILNGEVAVNPIDTAWCEACPFKTVCRVKDEGESS
jgi:ATP-dependent helicase/nuclease subunit B